MTPTRLAVRAAARLVACLLIAAATAVTARAEDALPPTIEPLLNTARAAAKPADRATAVGAIVAQKPDPDALATLLAARHYRGDLPTGWLRKTIVAADGKERPYILHVPTKYDPKRAYRMVIEMHGGVSRPQLLTHDELLEMRDSWGDVAEKDEWFLAFPAGERDAVWWDKVGSGMVIDIVRQTKRDYHVDENDVFATGFSDGGSGTWFLAAAQPTPFAGFLPLSGHVGVAGAGGLPIYLRNFLNKRVYATNTDVDQLYPSAGLKPVFDALATLGAPTIWRDIAGYGHDPRYIPAERPAMLAWMKTARRDTAPKTLTWEGADGSPSRIDWLRVTQVTGGSGVAPFEDINPTLTDKRVRLGVQVDQAFEGVGVRITDVVDGSVAAAMSIALGDVITQIDAAEIPSFAALRKALSAKKPGDDISVRVTRGEGSLDVKGKLPAAQTEPSFRRTKPHGTIEVRVKDNAFTVTSLGIGAFELFVSPRTVDMTKPVTVNVNGTQVFSGTVEPDIRFMLTQAIEDDDPSLLYYAKLDIAVPMSAPK